MYFDTHAHYTDEAYDEDRAQLISNLPGAGVSLVMNSANDRKTSLAAVALAEKYDFVYASVGWHPHDAKLFNRQSAEEIRLWVQHPKVLAIGEIGLDYYYDLSEREVQREVFIAQMELAQELKMPVVIHDRDAHGECMEIIRRFPDVKGAFHCYSGSVEMASEILERGWYLGFTGAITFKNARKAPEVLAMCPADRMLIETDCPYLAPVPFRGKRNTSEYLPYMADKIAEIKGMTREDVAAICMENGKRFFGIA